MVSWIFSGLGILFLSLGGSYLGVRRWKIRRWKELRESFQKKKMNEEQIREALKAKREMEGLISSPGWKTLMAIAKSQLSLRENEVLLKPTENPLSQEYQKGEIQGIKLFCQYPETVVENAKAVIQTQPGFQDETDVD